MAALLVAMGVMAVGLTVAMPVWKQMVQREKEEELVFRGKQYARAVGLYQRKYANAFPPSIDVLVEQRFLRKKYKDPITNADFVPLTQGQPQNTPGSGSSTASRPGETARTSPDTQGSPVQLSTGTGTNPMSGGGTPGGLTSGGAGGGPIGGIVGVTSKSKDKSIRIYNGRSRYNEWTFVFTPQVQAPGAGAPGAMPGGPGQRGGQQGAQGSSPFNPAGGIGRSGQGGQRGGGPGGTPFGNPGNPGGPGRSTAPFNPAPGPGRSGR
jgi:type II secretory pathway pseudopilin PulG